MNLSLEEKIIGLISRDYLTKDESLELIDDLYWADWDILKEKYPNYIENIFDYLKKEKLSNEEISQILKLYNNPHGEYIEEFSNIILDLYRKDKTKFIKSLNMEKEEVINLVYLFRNNVIKLDEDEELFEISKSGELSQEEEDTAEAFIKSYKNVCST